MSSAAWSIAEPLNSRAPIRPRTTDSPIPFTPIQRRMWEFLARKGRPLSLRMCASAVRVLGPLDIGHLQRSIEALIHRHESLRARLIVLDGTAQQHIDAPAEYRLNLVDLSNHSEGHTEVKVLVQEFLDQQIDLMTGPLFEAKLWKLSDREHVLVLLIDHFVCDGVSNGILTREMWTLYDQSVRGQSFSLPALAVQFADYAVWHQQTHAAWMQGHESYWRERLKGVQPLEVPLDMPPEGANNSSGATTYVPFGDTLSAALRDVARRERTLLSLVVLAAYVIVISNWCRRDDLLVEFVSHGRHRRPELQNVVGYLSNLIYFRIALSDHDTFRSLLTRIQLEFSSAFQHQDFDRVPDFIPECQSEVGFNWQPTCWVGGRLDHHVVLECASELDRHPPWGRDPDRSQGPEGGSIRIQPFAARSPVSVKFGPVMFDTMSGIYMAVAHQANPLAQQAIERFGQNMLFAMGELAKNPSVRIAVATGHMSW